ncbi:hypothetical protein FHS43_006602 [Streptosporangium becharense]|uniref:Cation/H+ exchanger domain-containing protein n=1 Tax=Streptosporangium becharense TaxID=1816182 RepID=A0A7W9IAA1_9ACTN|nr:cation:proton antiporter [Streptosporangium becharense]MBB2915282.1 hypothetical protein [Streptosporangium becharense]MBB5817020.1 hypothetical protein [Streptosporangium becharense]
MVPRAHRDPPEREVHLRGHVVRHPAEDGVSAAIGAFLVGLALTGEIADRARAVLTPLRDLFAAAFFLAIGLSVSL